LPDVWKEDARNVVLPSVPAARLVVALMTPYERELRIIAMEYVEENGNGMVAVQMKSSGGFMATRYEVDHQIAEWEDGSTPVAALTALIRSWGVEVPERPYAEGLAELAARADANGWRYLREFMARDPRGRAYVIALLEGDSA